MAGLATARQPPFSAFGGGVPADSPDSAAASPGVVRPLRRLRLLPGAPGLRAAEAVRRARKGATKRLRPGDTPLTPHPRHAAAARRRRIPTPGRPARRPFHPGPARRRHGRQSRRRGDGQHHAVLYSDLRDPVALLRGDRTDTGLAGYWPYAATDHPSHLDAGQVASYTALMAASQPLVPKGCWTPTRCTGTADCSMSAAVTVASSPRSPSGPPPWISCCSICRPSPSRPECASKHEDKNICLLPGLQALLSGEYSGVKPLFPAAGRCGVS